MNARFCSPAVRLLILSLLAVSPGAFSAPATGTVQFITDVYGRNENAGDAALTVIRNGDTNTGCSVNWSVTGGSAVALNDYSPTSGTLNFAAGETFKNITLFIVDDALVESNETVNLTLSGAANATISFPSNAVLTIFDNDVSNPPPVIQFVASVYGRFENQTAPLNLERLGDTNVSCSVQWSYTGGAAVPFSDFFGGSSTINFAAGQTIAALPISIIDDAVAESDETAGFSLQSPFNATLGSPSSATLTIYDNDVSNPPPATVVQFITDVYGRSENAGDASLTVTRSGDTSNACSVNWSVTGGSASGVADYSPGSGTLNFAAFETFKNISLLIVDDGIVESNETVNLTLSGAVNATIGFPSNAVLTIFDNDVSNPPPATVVQFITDVYGRSENAGDASLTVTRSGDTSNACSVNWSVTGGTALGVADYSPGSGTLNFAAFETFKNISLLIVDDGIVESNETVNLTLSGAVNATIGFPSNAVLTIFDNDVVLSADLQVTKTVNSNFVMVGQTVVFQLGLFNSGPNNITNSLSVNEAIPSGFQYVSDTSAASGTTYSAGLGQWTIPNGLGAGSNLFLNITVQATNTGIYTNSATVIVPAGASDPNTNNNSSSAVVTISNPPPLQAELQITKTANASGLPVGSNVVFNLVLRNNGPATVTNQVSVSDAIPPGFDYVGDNSGGSGNIYSFGLGLWIMPTGIVAGATQSLAITVRGTTAGTYTNTAIINVPNGVNDPNTNNNSSSAIVTVTNLPLPEAELQITKTASASGLLVGSNVVFHLVLRNNGPATVTNQVSVSDAIPPGFDYVADNSGGSGNLYSFGVGLWIMPTGIVAGATQSLAITLRGTTAGTYTNTARINLPNGYTDPDTNNNSSSVAVTVSNVPTYKITGLVLCCTTNGPGLTNVTVQLTGHGITNSTLTASNGSYMFTNLVAGSNYVLTPSLTNFTFLPTNLIVTVSSNMTVSNFLGFTYTLRGLVTEGTNGAPLPGVLLVLTNGPQVRTNLTDTNGVYVFNTVPAGVWKLTPATNGYTFVPTNVLVGLTNSLSRTNCTNVVNFVGLTKRIELIALEVTQVVQDWSNSVTLIRNKRTYVRAHVQLHTNTTAMAADGFRLRGFRGGTELMPTQTPLNQPGGSVLVQTNAVMRRGVWTNSVNFVLPDTWLSGTLDLRFEWTNGTAIFREPAEAGGIASNGAVRVSFVPSQVPQVKFFSINHTNAAGVTNMLTAAQERDLPRRVVSTFPIDRIDVKPVGSVPLMWPTPNPITADVLARMQRIRDRDRADTNRIYYGAIPGNRISGIAFVNGLAGAGYVPDADFVEGRQTHSHEIAHSLGRRHSTDPFFGYQTNRSRTGRIISVEAKGFCNETNPTNDAPVFPFRNLVNGLQRPTLGPMHNENAKIFGLDTLALDARIAPVVNPTQYFELMSYCSAPTPLPNLDEWPSSHTYEALRVAINSRYTPPAPLAPGPIVKLAPQNLLHISGVIDFFNESAQFFPFITMLEDTGPVLPPPGEYVLEMLDQNGVVVLQIPFEPEELSARGEEADQGIFFITLVNNPIFKFARIMREGIVLTAIAASANAPTIAVLAPNGGGAFGPGPITLTWSSQDADNEALTYDIQFSPDDGQTWETLDMDWPGLTYTIDHAHLPGTVAGRFRVFATDKFHSAWDQSDGPFVIAGHPPSVGLFTPAGGELFFGDQQIAFVADALDMEDGTLQGAAIQWTSSLDGAIGAGEQLTLAAAQLSEGTHLITATATDTAGMTGSSNVVIVVSRIEPPRLRIVQDGAEALVSWPAPAHEAGYHLQRALTLPGAWSNVTNAVEISEERAQVRLPMNDPAKFYRLIKP